MLGLLTNTSNRPPFEPSSEIPFSPLELESLPFGQYETLLGRIHGLLRSYTGGTGLIQELVQNADDAGATTFELIFDQRTFGVGNLPRFEMRALQGPALIAKNNATFSKEDWRQIAQLGRSGKSDKPSKTGRFGLGFNSVYNVTDYATIISEDWLGILDPHEETVCPGQPGIIWPLNEKLWSTCRDLLAPLVDYGLKPQSLNFNGTTFRLPIRTPSQARDSGLSNEILSVEEFRLLVAQLQPFLGELLLFLKNICSIELSIVNTAGERQILASVVTRNEKVVTKARSGIYDLLKLSQSEILAKIENTDQSALSTTYLHEVELFGLGADKQFDTYQLTLGFFTDPNGKLLAAAEQMATIKEKVVPLSGVASLYRSSTNQKLVGRVYCGLPLPASHLSPVPTMHVSGYFDVPDTRQGLMEDPDGGPKAKIRVQWNRCPIQHGCAQAMAIHCLRLAQQNTASGAAPYDEWPTCISGGGLLCKLPEHTYQYLAQYRCLHAGVAKNWQRPEALWLLPTQANPELYAPLRADEFVLAEPTIPAHVQSGFRTIGKKIRVLSAGELRGQLRDPSVNAFSPEEAHRPCLTKRSWILILLKYCTSDLNSAHKWLDLEGVPLAILASGTVQSFSKKSESSIFWMPTILREIFEEMPHWYLDEDAQTYFPLENSSAAVLPQMSPQLVVANLHAALSQGSPPSETWLITVFRYLAVHADQQRELRSELRKLPLIPDQWGNYHCMGSASTPLRTSGPQSPELAKVIKHFKVPIVSGSPELLIAIRNYSEAFPEISPGMFHREDSSIRWRQTSMAFRTIPVK